MTNMTLKEFFEKYPKAAIAFSGGVDSSYLLNMGIQYGADVKAYYVKSQFQPEFEMEDAVRLGRQLNANMEIIHVNVLENEAVVKNPENRCYYCKQSIFGTILAKAAADGYTVILDGTNASDDAGDRPGMKALQEMKVLSPLRMCGLTKTEIRKRSKEADCLPGINRLMPAWQPGYRQECRSRRTFKACGRCRGGTVCDGIFRFQSACQRKRSAITV